MMNREPNALLEGRAVEGGGAVRSAPRVEAAEAGPRDQRVDRGPVACASPDGTCNWSTL